MADLANQDEQVEMLVNNAGFGLTGRFADLSGKRQREMIDLNCGALTELAHCVLPAMIERRSGAILNVASTAAFQPGPGMAVYFATKAFVLSFSEALHEEVKRHGVRVSALCPGPTATEFGEVAGFGPSNLLDKFAADSPSVVRAGLTGLEKGKAVIIPGLMNKSTAQAHRFFPRSWVRRAAGMLKP
jgi:short-subunit dehydrogenase